MQLSFSFFWVLEKKHWDRYFSERSEAEDRPESRDLGWKIIKWIKIREPQRRHDRQSILHLHIFYCLRCIFECSYQLLKVFAK